MSVKMRCSSCGRKRVAFAENLTGAPCCRYCTERQLSEKLGRTVLLTPSGKDSVSGKGVGQLFREAYGWRR